MEKSFFITHSYTTLEKYLVIMKDFMTLTKVKKIKLEKKLAAP